MLVEELYMDCFRYQESSLAYYIHHLLEEGKISLDDHISKIDLNQADHQKVRELIRNNKLSFHKIGVYSLKMDGEYFVFIFAASVKEAIQYYTQTFQQSPLNCYEYSLDFELARGKDIISFRDLRSQIEIFPAVAGWFKRGG